MAKGSSTPGDLKVPEPQVLVSLLGGMNVKIRICQSILFFFVPKQVTT